jgi:cation transport regulator ChaC
MIQNIAMKNIIFFLWDRKILQKKTKQYRCVTSVTSRYFGEVTSNIEYLFRHLEHGSPLIIIP